jgi:RNA polymerase sigma factor (sigma-70 family)
MDTTDADRFESYRPLMFSIAYRMLGSVSEADDVVQEAFLRFHEALMRETSIESPRSYLATITTRASIDHLRRARARREQYVGEWLPEPVLEGPLPDAEEEHEEALEAPGRGMGLWNPRRLGRDGTAKEDRC